MEITIKEIEEQIFNLHLQAMIQKAYEQGIEDGRTKFALPKILTRAEAMELLKCGPTKMSELMAREDFPVNREIGVKIPTHMLLNWIEKNTRWVEENTNYFNKKVI